MFLVLVATALGQDTASTHQRSYIYTAAIRHLLGQGLGVKEGAQVQLNKAPSWF
jgi:hypothetical protein